MQIPDAFYQLLKASLTRQLLGAWVIIRFCFPKYLKLVRLCFFILEFWLLKLLKKILFKNMILMMSCWPWIFLFFLGGYRL